MSTKIVDSKIMLAKDFSSLMEWSISTIPKITSDWTDMSITSPEMVWLSAACYSYDILNYTLDRKFLNNQIRYSRSFDNLLNMCILNGVSAPGNMSSKVILKITFDTSELPDGDTIDLPKGSSFNVYDSSRNVNINLVVENDYTIESGDNLITCYEGTLTEREIDISYFTSVGTYIIEATGVGHNTVKVEINNVFWGMVEDAFLITDNSPSFSVHTYSDGYTLIKLVPGFSDLISSNTINLSYLITTGSYGNIGTSSEVEPNFVWLDEYSKKVKDYVTVTVSSSSGGEDAYNVDAVRSLLGTTSSDVITLVTEEDYEDVVKQIDYVYSCVVQSSGNSKDIYYVADKNIDSYGVTDAMIISDIEEAISRRVPAFTEYSVNPAIIRPVTLKVRVYLIRNELDITGLQSKIEDYISELFSRENIRPGLELRRNTIAIGVEDLSSSISHAIVEYPPVDIYTSWNEIVDIDSIEILFERG